MSRLALVTVTSLTDSALRTALTGGGTVLFGANGTVTLTNTLFITSNTVLDGNGYSVIISGGNAVLLFSVATNVTFRLNSLTLADARFVGTNGASGNVPFPGQTVRGACILSLGGNLSLNSLYVDELLSQRGRCRDEQ